MDELGAHYYKLSQTQKNKWLMTLILCGIKKIKKLNSKLQRVKWDCQGLVEKKLERH